MRAGRRFLASFIVLAFVTGFGVPSATAGTEAPPTIGRWFGAEAGFIETACYGFASGCPGFLGVAGFMGAVGPQETHKMLDDVDLVRRPWPARTGNYLFMAKVPGGTPGFGYLSTTGSVSGPVRPGTLSFAIRMHVLPLQPVVIYRHSGSLLTETPAVTISLAPDGRLLLSAAGSLIGATQPLITGAWHALTITYGAQAASPVRLYVDEQPPVTGTLALPGPSGDVDLGIVSPTNTPFMIGLDDIVESPAFEAPIRGARINYLMPLGDGAVTWAKSYPVEGCRNTAHNWQLVSEDQYVNGTNGDGQPVSCNLGGGAVTTSQNGAVDTYLTEGIASRHNPTPRYYRDLLAQPGPGDTVLGVRLRMRALTDGPPVPLSLGYLDQGLYGGDEIVFDAGGSGGSQMKWGPTHTRRPNGQSWTRAALGDLGLRLDSGPGLPVPVRRSVFAVRLDYVWVPKG